MAFTRQELEAMRLADAEIDADDFFLTKEEREDSRRRDAEAHLSSLPNDTAKRSRYNHEYYLAHKESMLSRSRRYREEHCEEYKDYQKRQYQKKKQDRLDYAADYYARNKEKILAKQKEYRAKKKREREIKSEG